MSVKEHERPSTDFTRTAIVGRIRGNVSRVDAKIKVEFDLRPRLAYYWWVPPREARSRFRSPVTTTCWSYAHPSPKGSNQSLSRLVLVPPPVHDTYKRPYQIVQIITTTTSRITTVQLSHEDAMLWMKKGRFRTIHLPTCPSPNRSATQ